MKRVPFAPIGMVVTMVGCALLAPPAGAQAPAETGLWIAPFSEDGNGDGAGDFDESAPHDAEESARLPAAVNAAVLADGRVLYWEQLHGSEDVDRSIALQRPSGGNARTRVLDIAGYVSTGERPSTAAWATPSPEDAGGGDLTGSEQRHLADGRVIAIGGTEWSNEDAAAGLPDGMGRTELYGLRNTRVFDPATNAWSSGAPMNVARYYPTLVTRPDGRLAAVGGAERLLYNSALAPGAHPPANVTPENVRSIETYDPVADRWDLDARQTSRRSLPLLPRLHLLPDGKLLYPAVGMLFAPGGGDLDAEGWNHNLLFDPVEGTWADAGLAQTGVRSNAFSALLPLRPPYDTAQVLVGGGTVGQWPSGYVATPLSELVTWTRGGGVERELTESLEHARWHSSAVVLPTGEVVALSGADKDEVVAPGSGVAVRTPELFDPETGTWRALAPAARDRTLHNTAVLLRDGSILVGGHAPAPRAWTSHGENPWPFSNNFKEPSFEILRPPYLFRGPRPVISAVSETAVHSGGAFTIDTPDASDPTLEVVLSRLPATTHAVDSDQRTVELEHRALDGDTVGVSLPDPAVVPPGPYYVFLLKDNGDGPTPSIGSVVHVVTCKPAKHNRAPCKPRPPVSGTGAGGGPRPDGTPTPPPRRARP